MPALVPELSVVNFDASLRFYRDLLGWQVVYDRPEEGFAYLRIGEADLMIDALATGRNFNETLTLANRPFGRGMNLEITLPDIQPLLDALRAAGWPLILPPEEKWYRAGNHQTGQHQFIVADPDGYFLRFCQHIGIRPIPTQTDAL
ncbi:MAG: VOC family protein [Paracoccus sp. (in: a-proteobacteria)]|uniref:bleomycin resistance protein n=1 Tax=Paracoccus sp. TaxID=267 RepID=UPI0026DEEF9A|nr:VOC family protein [Paracoccus sp. (in: a-proteobacteria)]MDO5621885.1 VOC family protein [Paracoccus sp. (in: a-proteobacteria)]